MAVPKVEAPQGGHDVHTRDFWIAVANHHATQFGTETQLFAYLNRIAELIGTGMELERAMNQANAEFPVKEPKTNNPRSDFGFLDRTL